MHQSFQHRLRFTFTLQYKFLVDDTRRVENELWRIVSADIAMRLSFSHKEKSSSSSAILFDESRSFDLRLIFAPFLS